MICIYGKWKVWNALKIFCEHFKIPSEIIDDTDKIEDFSHYESIIPSPGIAPSHRIYGTGKILGELDFIYGFLPKGFKLISITGTDGKSTTAWILYNLLKQEYGEGQVFLSGNFDIPFSETVRIIKEKWLKKWYIVLEISSFMAYNIKTFKSTHSIFTNFETDHLNWHTTLQDYFNAKMRLFQATTGTSVVNEQVFENAEKLGLKLPKNLENVRVFGEIKDENNIVIPNLFRKLPLNLKKDEEPEINSGWRKLEISLRDRTNGEDIIISGRKKYHLSETQFSGVHNTLNILSATIITNAMKICSKRIREYLHTISGLSHRLELVVEKNGIRFIDDSKSTSAQSLIVGLGSFADGKVCLIAGGSDKGDAFEHLWPILAQKVKHAELIGQTREIFGRICEQHGVSYHYSDSMDEAVRLSSEKAKEGDIVLLSPGCASFGMFRDYLDRAEKFREVVKNL